MESACSSSVAGVPGTGSTPTKLDCAKAGIRALLGTLYPCDLSLVSCGSVVSGNDVANPLDRVGLMVFPGLNSPTSTNLAKEIDCVDNVFSSDVSYSNSLGYKVIPFSSNYRTSAASGLNKSSDIVKSIYWDKCPSRAYPYGGGGGSSSIVGGGTNDRSSATNGPASRPGRAAERDRSGATNGAGIAAGPSGGSDRAARRTEPRSRTARAQRRIRAARRTTQPLPVGLARAADRSGATNGPALGGRPNSGDPATITVPPSRTAGRRSRSTARPIEPTATSCS